MSRVILRRRPDGIVQIRRRPLWRAIAGPVPAVLLALLLGCTAVQALLAAALVRFPALTLLLGGCAALALAAVRWGLTEPAVARTSERRHPPGDAA
jgi:hypothetical protein